ncbi:MAG: exodeoxyribonuclease VII large subunit [Anaerolineaceae bacterium]|nr:exodeoxyribonuclease VII large subunit [Anaerolineaceae bacterium]
MDFDQPILPSIALGVSDLTRYMRQLLESDEVLQDIWVQGEISNLSRPSSGHIYFTLKDESAALRCVIWRSTNFKLKIGLQNGAAIEAHGHVSLYERDGTYQLYVDGVRMAGEGWLYQEFMRLKNRLEAEGLFDPERKRAVPSRPERIGIVTSPTGAALQDILNTLRRRYPLVEAIISPAAVQGEDAPLQIIAAINRLNRQVHPDVILLARGGGSLEDLWAFNDERVIRAIVNSEAPVISGVGHETDFTLADFAADVRAPTPTGAAVLATPDIADLKVDFLQLLNQLNDSFISLISTDRAQLSEAQGRLRRSSPLWLVQNDRQRLDELSERAARALRHSLQLKQTQRQGLHDRLQALNPMAVLQRGFAIVKLKDGVVVQSLRQVQAGQQLDIHLADGQFGARVEGDPHPST